MVRESKVIIAENIKLDNTYKNVLSYNQTQMLNLVTTNAVATGNNYSFIREFENKIQVKIKYSQICNANYIAFQNKDYNNRWFFAFIKDVQYVGEDCTNIIFETDVWSTFYSSLTINDCFVEREHVNDDTIGLHTVPENIDTGDMVCESATTDGAISSDLLDYWVGMFCDWLPLDSGTLAPYQKNGKQYSGITVYNKNVGGHALLLFRLKQRSGEVGDWDTHVPDLTDLKDFIETTNADGHIEDIKDIFILPNGLFESGDYSATVCTRTIADPVFASKFKYYTAKQSLTAKTWTYNVPKVHSFNGITIKNNKCYCYPYNYLLVSNNQGNQNIYKYEFFGDTNNATFTNELGASIGCSGRTVPTNYLGDPYNNDESLPLGKFPTCGWTADSYTNWLTQQSINLPTKLLTMAGGTSIAIATGNFVGAGALLGGGGISLLNEFRAEGLKPNIEGGGNTADIVFGTDNNTFTYKCMRSKKEDIEIIDNYFSRFGYKINETKTPNLTGRAYWNYIKIGNNDRFASGNIQTKFLDTINQIAQAGVTIWHNHANIGNFDLNNTIV